MRGSNFFFPADLRNECKKKISALQKSTNAQKAGVREQFRIKVNAAKHDRNEVLMQIEQEHEKERQLIVERYESLVSERLQEKKEDKPQLLHL